MAYASVTQLRVYLTQLNPGQASDEALGVVLDRATQVIDTELGFAFDTAAAGTRVVYGDGTDYLVPPRFVAGSVTTVTAPGGWSVPTYAEHAGTLIIVDSDGRQRDAYRRRLALPPASDLVTESWPSYGWVKGLPYTVAATFGWASVPTDIVECALEIAVRIWRARDAGFSDVVGVGGEGGVGYNGALPNLVKRVLGHYKAGTSVGVW